MNQFMFLLASYPEHLPLFYLDRDTINSLIGNTLNVLLIFFIVAFILYRPVRDFMKRRTERINGELQDAASNMKAAQELKAEYERKVNDIESERIAILDDARKQANERRNELLAEAKHEAESVKERALREIAMERERVKGEIHHAIIDISSDMAAKLVDVSIDQSAHDKLFAEAMAELEATVFNSADRAVVV